MTSVIGVDIGGTKIAAVLTDHTYRPLVEHFAATPEAAKPTSQTPLADRAQASAVGRRALLDEVIALCRTLQQAAIERQLTVEAIGVGSAGQIDSHTGIVLDANENLVGWRGTPLGATLEQTFGVPVAVDNDVRTMALAECQLGAGKDYEHVLCLTVGTGIGGALVLHSRLWHGAHFSAGEIGYLYASPQQTIEQMAAGPALEHQYQRATGSIERLPLHIIAQRAMTGDETARSVIETGAQHLGRVLAPIIAFIDPQAVVIGGGLTEIDALWWQPLVQTIKQSPLLAVQQTPLLKATLGARAGMIGAAILAMQKKVSRENRPAASG